MKKSHNRFSLKDHLFNDTSVSQLAFTIDKVYPEFDSKNFIKESLKRFPDLELKQRISWMTTCLEKYLPEVYDLAIDILIKSAHHARGADSKTRDYVFAVYSDFVERNGLSAKYLHTSLHALGVFTSCSSAEGAIRAFLNNFKKETFSYLDKWVVSPDLHQRRLVSEGLRPSLPWYTNIQVDYKSAAPYLSLLYYDDSRYVTRSVANHLNDISKFDIKFVINLLSQWKKAKRQTDKEMNYIIQHALRTSIKRGEEETLEFLGYSCHPKIQIEHFEIRTPRIRLGERLEFSFIIIALENENVIVDYEVGYFSPHTKTSHKVFKIKTLSLKKGEKVEIKKGHLFKMMTTKRLYSGQHDITIKVNGSSKTSWKDSFDLVL